MSVDEFTVVGFPISATHNVDSTATEIHYDPSPILIDSDGAIGRVQVRVEIVVPIPAKACRYLEVRGSSPPFNYRNRSPYCQVAMHRRLRQKKIDKLWINPLNIVKLVKIRCSQSIATALQLSLATFDSS